MTSTWGRGPALMGVGACIDLNANGYRRLSGIWPACEWDYGLR